MNIYPIKAIEHIIQTDLCMRGINFIPDDNLCTRTHDHLLYASQKIVAKPGATVGIITGFYIPHGNPPAPETDGPLGTLMLARGLNLLGYKVIFITDSLCIQPLKTGMNFFSEQLREVEIIEFPFESIELNRQTNELNFSQMSLGFVKRFYQKSKKLEFIISIERVGPNHTSNSFSKQSNDQLKNEFEKYGPRELTNQCLNMGGKTITAYTAKIHLLFEHIYGNKLPITTIGIGDGGNEIGMGTIPWQVIHKNSMNDLGGKIACRIPTDYTIVSGVSNWGGYALTAAIYFLLQKQSLFLDIFQEQRETKFLQHLIKNRIAIDGRLGHPNMSIDGLDWDIHLAILKLIKSTIINR